MKRRRQLCRCSATVNTFIKAGLAGWYVYKVRPIGDEPAGSVFIPHTRVLSDIRCVFWRWCGKSTVVLKTLHKEAGGVAVVSLVVNQPESNGITFGFALFLHLMLTFYSWLFSLGTKNYLVRAGFNSLFTPAAHRTETWHVGSDNPDWLMPKTGMSHSR